MNFTQNTIPTKTVGFIVNPVAGMGGAVGLKGTDGKEILNQAIALGAKPIASQRAKTFLTGLIPSKKSLNLIVGVGDMGQNQVGKMRLYLQSCGRN